jgi:23S rRNA pseudouridine1911/1915/1917 synthase
VTNGEWAVLPVEAGSRLDKFLAAPGRLGSRTRATTAIDRGKVFVNAGEAGTADAALRLQAGDVVRVWMDRPGSARTVRARVRREGELVVVYEDASLLVVNKPPGLLAVPLPRRGDVSLADLVERHLRSQGKRRPHVVHRIDRDTSGLVVFAKDGPTLAHLKQQFLRREPERIYQAVVYGRPSPEQGSWRDRLVWDRDDLVQRKAAPGDPRAKDAVSEYRVRRHLRGASLVDVRLVTGKRNQIRVQAALRGHPLVGETIYVEGRPSRPIAFPRQALHAWRLGFAHPVTGRAVQLEAPLPDDMAGLVEELTVG